DSLNHHHTRKHNTSAAIPSICFEPHTAFILLLETGPSFHKPCEQNGRGMMWLKVCVLHKPVEWLQTRSMLFFSVRMAKKCPDELGDKGAFSEAGSRE